MKTFKLLIASSLLLSPFVSAATVAPAVSSEVLLQTDHAWTGAPYAHYPAGQPAVTLLRITIPAHAVLPWHRHPAPNVAYVQSGTLTVETRDTHQTKVLHAGDALAETVDTVHRGVAGDEPVVLLVFYAGAKGVPLSVVEP
jgi:quercetin dioxygenase-like cupin family protein